MASISLEPQAKGQELSRSLLSSLRDSRLLSDDQFAELQGHVQGFDMQALTAFLLKRGWLTAYQLGEVLDGRARGLVIGQYRLLDELGEGGFGKVYKAVHAMMKREAALKVIQVEIHLPRSNPLRTQHGDQD